VILSRVRREPQRLRRTDQFDVDVVVVLIFAIPGERHLFAIRREAGLLLGAATARERYDVERS